MMKTVSVHLPFTDIVNMRDLAGIPAANGKVIAPGRLVRSANLHKASKQTQKTLQDMGLTDIVDLRTDWERFAQPDPEIDQTDYHHFPVFHEESLSRMAGGQIALAEDAVERAYQMMEMVYAGMLLTPTGQQAWKNLFQLLLSSPKMVIWHCTQGKDRTGIAAMLILHALGVDDDLIQAEYMQTNEYLAGEDARDRMEASAVFEHHQQKADEDVDAYMLAHERYYNAAQKAVMDYYGSWDNYLQQACGMGPEEIEQLRSFYLE